MLIINVKAVPGKKALCLPHPIIEKVSLSLENFFYGWLPLFSPSCPEPDDPALILCPLSFRCQRCPHRGTGNSQKPFFLSANRSTPAHAAQAVQTGKVKHFINDFSSSEPPKRNVALTQNPRMKKFHESSIQAHVSKSNKGKAPF